jgi:prolyl-tRNA editing enzyme YbaK/EbsC (Cys-tRNA(Pro) deacylase)
MSRMVFAAIAVLAVSAGVSAKGAAADLSGRWVLTASPSPASRVTGKAPRLF